MARSTDDTIAILKEFAHSQFTLCRDLETSHHEKLLDIASDLADKLARHELDEEIDIELQAVTFQSISFLQLHQYLSPIARKA